MSHYTPMHARDGQRRDDLRARARGTWTRAAAWLRRRAMIPARLPVQAPRPADPPHGPGAVRAGATLAAIGDAFDDLGGLFPPPAPAPRAADHAGQATGPAAHPPQPAAAVTIPPGDAVALPQPAPSFPPGLGQRPSSRAVHWRGPDGSVTVIGYGPVAQIPRPYAQARVTGAHAVIPGSAPLVPRRYAAFEARRDQAARVIA